jgi:hypothetical protein
VSELPPSLKSLLAGAADFTVRDAKLSQIDFGKIPADHMDVDRIRIDFFDRLKEQLPDVSGTVLCGEDEQHPTYEKFRFIFAKPVSGRIAADITEGVMEEEWKRAGFMPRDFDPQVTHHLDNSPQPPKRARRGHTPGQ